MPAVMPCPNIGTQACRAGTAHLRCFSLLMAFPAPMSPVPASAPTPQPVRPAWRGETSAGMAAAAAALPLLLTLGTLAFSPAGADAAAIGIPASVIGTVAGGAVLALASRTHMPTTGPSSATALIFAAFLARLLADPALDFGQAAGRITVLALCALLVLGTGVLLLGMSLLRLGLFVRFVPRPVLAGFMNAVALLIFASQLPVLLGGGDTAGPWLPALLAGLATLLSAWAAARWLPRLPALMVGLLAGMLVATAMQLVWPLAGALPAVGTLPALLPPPPLLAADPLALLPLLQRHGVALGLGMLLLALIGALESLLGMLAVHQHQGGDRLDPNRELRALGLANMASGLLGGLPVAYLRLSAMAALQAGGRSPRSAQVAALLLALGFVLAAPLLVRLPLPVLAGLMLFSAFALVDRWTSQLARQWWTGDRSAALHQNLLLVAVVCAATLAFGFVTGVALGLVLSVVVFIRTMNHSLLRARHGADRTPSRRVYPPEQEKVLAPLRHQIDVIELEGALFFGSSERLADAIDARPAGTRFVVLDFRRVSSIDASGAVGLQQVQQRLAQQGVVLLLAGVQAHNRHGRSLQALGTTLGTTLATSHADADRAIEAAEQALLDQHTTGPRHAVLRPEQCDLFDGLTAAEWQRLQPLLRPRHLAAGEVLFREGDPGDALYVLTAGSLSVLDSSAAPGAPSQRFVSFSAGMTLGETALLDGGGRSALGVADVDSALLALQAADLLALQQDEPALAARLHLNLARHLSQRLRSASMAWRQAAL